MGEGKQILNTLIQIIFNSQVQYLGMQVSGCIHSKKFHDNNLVRQLGNYAPYMFSDRAEQILRTSSESEVQINQNSYKFIFHLHATHYAPFKPGFGI